MFPHQNVDYDYHFYTQNNPKLYQVMKSLTAKRDLLEKNARELFELRASNISNLGSLTDEINKKIETPATAKPQAQPQVPQQAISPQQQKAFIAWLEIEKMFNGLRILQSDKQYILAGDSKYDYDENGNEIDDTVKIENIRIGPESYLVNARGELYNSRTNKGMILTEERLIVLLAPSGAVIEDYLLNKGAINDVDISTVGFFLSQTGLFQLPATQKQKDDVVNGNSNSKLRILRKYMILAKGSEPQFGKGLQGAGLQLYKSDDELIEKLDLLIGSKNAGNTSTQLKNDIAEIADKLHDNKVITQAEYKLIYNKYVV